MGLEISLVFQPSMAEEQQQRQILRDVFGTSSSDDSETETETETKNDECPQLSSPLQQTTKNPSRVWDRIQEINGLWFCKEFLSVDQQSALLADIANEGWFIEETHNQAMKFGDLPCWAIELSNLIRDALSSGYDYDVTRNDMETMVNKACVLPSHLLWRKPFFDQFIVNVYQPGEGIGAHVDLMCFEDGIAIVSLESSCVMDFTEVVQNGGDSSFAKKVPLCLPPGSLVIMWGDARYRWNHEINRMPRFQIWEGQEIDQRKRTSITLRKLRRSE